MAETDTVEEYLSQVPKAERAALEKVRATIKAAVPNTTEAISYQMPTFKYQGRALVGIAAFKDHCSLFPYSKRVLETLKKDLESYDTAGKGGTIRFTVDRQLPAAIIRKIVKARIAEIEARGSKSRSH
jgi:uncharacterized protein YdhG (YjbR/CyaY superfamily)